MHWSQSIILNIAVDNVVSAFLVNHFLVSQDFLCDKICIWQMLNLYMLKISIVMQTRLLYM